MPSSSRTAQCGTTEARSRLRTARAYLEVAALVLDERDRDEYLNVSAGLAVLAGIAASDSICCARLRSRHRGDDHRGAADLLRRATPDGPELAVTLLRLLDLKDEAHYGVMVVAARNDFWRYALFPAVACSRAAASRAGLPARQACQDLGEDPR